MKVVPLTKTYKNEAAFQNDVMQFLKHNPNAFAVKYWAGNKFTVNGIPDVLACINGVFHGIELKTNTGVVRGIQKENETNQVSRWRSLCFTSERF